MKKEKAMVKRLLAMLCVFAVTISSLGMRVPVWAEEAGQNTVDYVRLYDFDQMVKLYLKSGGEAEQEYPSGAFMLPLASAEMRMEDKYAIDVFREGGTKGEASITVKSIDLTAGYGEDYAIFVDDKPGEAVEGKANRYYGESDYSFLATYTQREVIAASNKDENVSQIRKQASEYNDELFGAMMPTSSECTLHFADGEKYKTIYIQTYRKEEVTSDLTFALNLCEPKGGSIGVQTSCTFTILEEREKPQTYLKLCNSQVNPKSEEAYIVVERSGNMGTEGSFTIRTESGTAKAGQAYDAVQMPLTFLPGMKEIRVPVKMLSGAKDGTGFYANLEDCSGAESKGGRSEISVTKKAAKEEAHMSTFTAASDEDAMVYTSEDRSQRIVNAARFDKFTCTKRGAGSPKGLYQKAGEKDMEMIYDNGCSIRNNGVSARSQEKISFTGVDTVAMATTNYFGSTVSDQNMFYVADDDEFDSKTSNYDWVKNLPKRGRGDYWNMTNISDGYLDRRADVSKVTGEHYLFIALHKAGVVGKAGFKIFNQGKGKLDHNIRLYMHKYHIKVIEPEEMNLYEGGTSVPVRVAQNHLLVDPASVSGSAVNTGKEFDIYRDEATSISGVIDSKYQGQVRLAGVHFVNQYGRKSLLCELDGTCFRLTPEIIEKYSSYFSNDNIIIQPEYTMSAASFEVAGYEDEKTGQKFVVDSAEASGKLYLNDALVGTLKWTKSERDEGKYCVGDELNFTMTYEDEWKDSVKELQLDTRAAATKELLSKSEIHSVRTTGASVPVRLSDLHFSVTPVVHLNEATIELRVLDPDKGDFSGKGGKFATVDKKGVCTVTGYSVDGNDVKFSNFTAGDIIALTAKPKDQNEKAVWTYTDSATHKQRRYCGNVFFYAVQNPWNVNDNHVSLTFEQGKGEKSEKVEARVNLQRGSIINPPTDAASDYAPAPDAQITLGEYDFTANKNGYFYPCDDSGFAFEEGETYRALVTYNAQKYLCDFKPVKASGKEIYSADLNMDYKTFGVAPKSIRASDQDGINYGDTITLISAKKVTFVMEFGRTGEAADKPVNLARWTVESDDLKLRTVDVDIKEGESAVQWTDAIAETIKQGSRLYIELMWKGKDNTGKEIMKSYGKFDTGYQFVASAIEDSITYAPDISNPSTLSAPTAPVLGPISPTVSFYGFAPIFNVGSSGKDKDGHELKTLTLGISYSRAKDAAAEDPKWGTLGPIDQLKKMDDILNSYNAAINNGENPKNAFGKNLTDALNMKTSVKVSINVALCFQGTFYEENGERKYVGSNVVIGIGGTVRVSTPFVLLYIPCFAYFTVSIEADIYMGIFPNADAAPGQTVALTAQQLSDKNMSNFQGVYELKINLGLGVGVGFDGLLSVSGGVDFTFDIQFNDFLRGIGTVGAKGNITLTLFFFKKSWTKDFFKATMFNTLGDKMSLLNNEAVRAEFEEDLLKNTTLRDMTHIKPEGLSDEEQMTVLAPANRAKALQEKIAIGEESMVHPEMIAIGDDKYLIVSTASNEDVMSGHSENVLHYYIYDEAKDQITKSDPILAETLIDMGAANTELTEQIENDLACFDSDPVMTDCGDEILIVWNGCSKKPVHDANGELDQDNKLEMLKSMGIASVYYHKASGLFHDYKMMTDPQGQKAYHSPRVAYNDQTNTAQIFYQAMDMSDVTLDTTLEELQKKETTVQTVYRIGGDPWSQAQDVAIGEKYLKFFDVTQYGDDILLSYVADEESGFTLEDTDDFEVTADFDDSQFGTQNALYIQRFGFANGELKPEIPICMAEGDRVLSNPEFIEVRGKTEDSREIKNTLLFYKFDGYHGYQNVTNILEGELYETKNQKAKLLEDEQEPDYITSESDNEINEDFDIFTNGKGDIYALWTVSEGYQQQIWAKQFVLNEMTEITETPKQDANGDIIYESEEGGIPKMETLDQPLYILNGFWGGKTYLTEGGVGALEDVGLMKKNFTASILDNGDILAAFNAYDMNTQDEDGDVTNNMFVVAEYDASPDYHAPKPVKALSINIENKEDPSESIRHDFKDSEALDAIEFDNVDPSAGETIQVTCHAENSGVKSGRDVTVSLFVNGEEYDKIEVPVWLASEKKDFDFAYTLPEDKRGDQISMCYVITENNEEKFRSDSFGLKHRVDLDITMMTLTPQKRIVSDNDTTQFFVRATVRNDGNKDYPGGDFVKLVEEDTKELYAALRKDIKGEEYSAKPVYTLYGKGAIPELKVGESAEVCFLSDEIPAGVFEKTNTDTAILKGFIADKSEIKTQWTGKDVFSNLAEFDMGATRKPVPDKAKSITAEALALKVGQTELLQTTVSPISALSYDKISYTSSDPKVAVVDDRGFVTGVKDGTATLTARIGDVKTSVPVTVGQPLKPGQKVPSVKVTLNKKTASMYVGKTLKLTAAMTPKNATDALIWKSSKPKVASVSNKGEVKAKKAGKTTITVTTTSGKTAACQITVKQIKVEKAKIKALSSKKKKTLDLTIAHIKGAKGYEIVYSESKKFVKKKTKKLQSKKRKVTIKKLKRGRTYYVKARAYKKNALGKTVYGKYSKVRKVKIR